MYIYIYMCICIYIYNAIGTSGSGCREMDGWMYVILLMYDLESRFWVHGKRMYILIGAYIIMGSSRV